MHAERASRLVTQEFMHDLKQYKLINLLAGRRGTVPVGTVKVMWAMDSVCVYHRQNATMHTHI